MTPEQLTVWRKARRGELLATRESFDAATRTDWGRRISRAILAGFPILKGANIAVYWPIRAEYDPRFVAHALRDQGSSIGLPVVVGKGQPLIFREWHPGTEMLAGAMNIPYPAPSAPAITPDACIIPPVGFDACGYRLGYGAGFFDRTLAAVNPRPLAIGVAFECARMQDIHPQSYDIALDFIVTEQGVHAVNASGLVLVDAAEANSTALRLQRARRQAYVAAQAPESGGLASPVCYADELAQKAKGEFGAE